MARGWHYTMLSLSSVLLLSFSGMCIFYCSFLFVVFVFVFCCVFLLSLELCSCSSDILLSSRPRTTGLATTYITGYGRGPIG